MHYTRIRHVLLEVYSSEARYQAEVEAVAKGLQQGIFANFLRAGQSPIAHCPICIYQHNMGTMKLIDNGRANSELTRCISISYSWAPDPIY